MIHFLEYALATIGLTNIIVHGRIMELLRIKPLLKKFMGENWSSLFECYECTGFWAGMFCSYLVLTDHWMVVLACGFAGSVLAQTYADAMMWLRSKIEFEVGNDGTTAEKSA